VPRLHTKNGVPGSKALQAQLSTLQGKAASSATLPKPISLIFLDACSKASFKIALASFMMAFCAGEIFDLSNDMLSSVKVEISLNFRTTLSDENFIKIIRGRELRQYFYIAPSSPPSS
jgi:hypothetical protein